MNISLELQPCCGQRSGIGFYTYELAKRLYSSSDFHFQGNVFNFLNRNDNKSALSDISFHIKTSHILPYGIYRRMWHFTPINYDFFFGKTDLTHFFNFIVPPKISGKVIDTVHDLTYLYYPKTMDSKNLKHITSDIEYSLNRSDIITVVSENTKIDLLKEYSLNEDKIRVIYPSASLTSSQITKKQLFDKYRLAKPYILYVGNLEPRKNLVRLIKAYKHLKTEMNIPFQLVIVGGKSWQYENIFKTVSNLGLSEDIIFTGYVTSEEKTAFYKYAALFVYPALYEGFGMPILEALGCEAPVVCSKTSSMPEVGGKAAYYVNPLDTLDIADGMYKMLTDEALKNSKIAFAKLQAQKFSWEKSADKLIDIYKEFL